MMETVSRSRPDQWASSGRPGDGRPPTPRHGRRIRQREEARHVAEAGLARLSLVTTACVPVAISGVRVLVVEEGGRIGNDLLYVLIAATTIAACGVLLGVLGLVVYVLADAERTDRFVRILSTTFRRERRRRRR